ncbi:MAG: glycine zipper family protein [Gammaproteobacteria bacterium]|nr:hypothetical protein [Pseudomonadales bacterium]MCP5348460.1 glycine zipper family protein [Pseudomonadales bacterium]
MEIRTSCFVFCTVLGACAAADRRPIVDMAGVDPGLYQVHLEKCRSYAGQVETGTEVALGALVSAVGLAAAGAFFGDSELTGRAVGVGLVTGSTEGAVKVMAERNLVQRNCMQARGYAVFN